MPFQAKTRVALIGGAVMVALAARVGGGVLLSDTTTPTSIATPTSSVAPTSPPTDGAPAPSTDTNVPGGSNGDHMHMSHAQLRVGRR